MRHYLDIPEARNSFYDSRLRYDLAPNIYFVYGSNEAGAHGAGAALDAVNNYGARYGNGFGFSGQSYGIPTKDSSIRTLRLEQIQKYIEDFVRITREGNHYFFVTAVGTGLAGYRHETIAPLFKGVRNCWLPDVWEPYLT